MNYYEDDEEEEVIFGTPFDPLEVEEIVSKRPEIDLTVRDSRGRRRFHGAFTGGFSAGFWNTVGSQEGFTPSQYVSKRDEKWDQTLVHRKPEDFMDSEDLDVFGIAPKRIRTKEKFGEQEFAGFRDSNASLIDVLKSVIKPSVESIGLQLYKQMKRKARIDDNYSETKVYGCEKPSNIISNSDLPFCIYKPKSDFHGIGYKGINNETNNSNESMSSNGVSAVLSSGRKLKITGEAFGYGVLDEDNEDDAVVYQRDDMSQYDFAIGKQMVQKIDKHKAIEVLKTDTIEKFVKCSTKTNLMEIISKKYSIPVLPRNWKPRGLSIANKSKKSRWDQTSGHSSVEINANKVNPSELSKPPVLNANIRAVLLGQEVIHRQGIKSLEIEKQSEISLNSSKVSSDESNEKLSQRKNDSFGKPLFGFWANKFTRSSIETEENTISGGLTQFKSKQSVEKVEQKENETNNVIERIVYEWHPHHILCKRFNIPNPFPQYPDVVGIVTVGKTDVRNRTSHLNSKKNKPNIFEGLFEGQNMSNDMKTSYTINDTNPRLETESNRDESIVNELHNIVDKVEEKEETSRPPMDLFKEIFASDEEESDDEITNNDNANKGENLAKINTENDKQVIISNNNNNMSELSATKASGIFANIDFDQLNRHFTPIMKTNETQKSLINETINEKTNCQINDSKSEPKISDAFYGPALPPNYSSIIDNVYKNINLSEVKTKSLKRKKREKKHKKHKKHSRHKRSSSSSSSTEINVDLKILNYFKNSRK